MDTTNTIDTKRQGRPSTYSPEVIEKAVEALRAGMKVREVAKLTGMSETSVTYYKSKRLSPASDASAPVSKLAPSEQAVLNRLDAQIAKLTASIEADREALREARSKRNAIAKAFGLVEAEVAAPAVEQG
jgi:hypothetical protein